MLPLRCAILSPSSPLMMPAGHVDMPAAAAADVVTRDMPLSMPMRLLAIMMLLPSSAAAARRCDAACYAHAIAMPAVVR